MKKSYLSPQVEVIEIEIEDAVLQASPTGSIEDFLQGTTFGDDF